jgi:hypothetical protein
MISYFRLQIYDPLGGQTPEESLQESGLMEEGNPTDDLEASLKAMQQQQQNANGNNGDSLNQLDEGSGGGGGKGGGIGGMESGVGLADIILAGSVGSGDHTGKDGAATGVKEKKTFTVKDATRKVAKRRAAAKKLSRFMSASPLAAMLRVKQMHEDLWIDSIVSRQQKMLFVRRCTKIYG